VSREISRSAVKNAVFVPKWNGLSNRMAVPQIRGRPPVLGAQAYNRSRLK
jgi:hypothetical protein